MVKLKPLKPPTSSSGPDTKRILNLRVEEAVMVRLVSPHSEASFVMSWRDDPDSSWTKDWRQ